MGGVVAPRYKRTKNLRLEEQAISPEPDFVELALTAEDEFLVLACDGIWNSMDNGQVVQFVSRHRCFFIIVVVVRLACHLPCCAFFNYFCSVADCIVALHGDFTSLRLCGCVVACLHDGVAWWHCVVALWFVVSHGWMVAKMARVAMCTGNGAFLLRPMVH
jgi:hypothetical protein